MSVPYRPSNGVEGEMFMERFCFRCAKDAAFQNGIGDSCPIAAATMIYDEDDPKYPPEWIEEDGYPRCTAFTLDASQEERERYEARRDPSSGEPSAMIRVILMAMLLCGYAIDPESCR